jgi:hypothetical protein
MNCYRTRRRLWISSRIAGADFEAEGHGAFSPPAPEREGLSVNGRPGRSIVTVTPVPGAVWVVIAQVDAEIHGRGRWR